jgi:hypothetical protein
MANEPLPRPATGAHNPIADDDPRGEAGTPLAPPPVEAPGPSVPPPTLPQSDTEREEWADATKPDPEILDLDDPLDELVAEEESAAMAEARAIGGPVPPNADDPAMEPVYQAGGGEQEGFEQAEADLIENATHGDGGGNPLRDAIAPEVETDRSSAVYAESDDYDSTEVVVDPDEGPDDPAAGPGISKVRGSD